MKPLLILILLSLALSCTDKPVTQFATLLNPGNLKEQAFDIDVTKDTVIVTGGGAKISISANAIAADGNTVTLLVKQQVIRLDVRETTQDTIMQAVVSLQLNKVAVAIEKTKNFETLKEIDAELKKTANGCGCNERMPADTITYL